MNDSGGGHCRLGSVVHSFGSCREAFEAKKMGQYQLKKLLGRRRMGEVYLVGLHAQETVRLKADPPRTWPTSG
ncbi:MAG: hypothetical protein R3C56_39405 [Pirellulaceae bacterium]